MDEIIPNLSGDEHHRQAMDTQGVVADLSSSDYDEGEVELYDATKPSIVVHECAFCNKVFRTRQSMRQHMNLHSHAKAYQCMYCEKAFNFRGNLKQHLTLHVGFEPFKCHLCDYKVRLRSNIKPHMLSHHANVNNSIEELMHQFNQENPLKKKQAPRPPLKHEDLPKDAIVIKEDGLLVSHKPLLPKKNAKKYRLGLGMFPERWIRRISQGQLLPTLPIGETLEWAEERTRQAKTFEQAVELAKSMPFEQYNCLMCQVQFVSRHDCLVHVDEAHPEIKDDPLFCQICIRLIANEPAMEQHQSYHAKVRHLLNAEQVEQPALIDLGEEGSFMESSAAEPLSEDEDELIDVSTI